MNARALTLSGRSLWIIGGLAVLGYAVTNIVVTNGSTFWHDEWWYICGRSLGDIASWFRPHNEHFVLLHVVAYRLLVEVFGIGSYLPFQLALIGTHVGAVSAVFVLVDRHGGRTAAAAAAALLLFLGWGSLNLFWAFQIGFVGATALGLWALVLLPDRPALAALVLTAAVATQGIGLVYVVAAAGYLVGAGRIRSTVWMLIPVLAYGMWALTMRAPIDARAQLDVSGALEWMAIGVAWAVAGTMGLGLVSAAIGVMGVVVSGPTAWRSPLVVSAVLGLLAQYALLGVVRQDIIAPWAGHYVYVGAVFVILAGATLLASAKRPRVGVVLFVIAMTANIVVFVSSGSAWVGQRQASRLEGSDDVPASACYESPTLEELRRLAGVDGQ
jgi:hypothetical protein